MDLQAWHGRVPKLMPGQQLALDREHQALDVRWGVEHAVEAGEDHRGVAPALRRGAAGLFEATAGLEIAVRCVRSREGLVERGRVEAPGARQVMDHAAERPA